MQCTLAHVHWPIHSVCIIFEIQVVSQACKDTSGSAHFKYTYSGMCRICAAKVKDIIERQNLADAQAALTVPVTIAADDILKYDFLMFQIKIRLNISCELSAKQTVHMKYQALLSLKSEKKKKMKLECHTLPWCFLHCIFSIC